MEGGYDRMWCACTAQGVGVGRGHMRKELARACARATAPPLGVGGGMGRPVSERGQGGYIQSGHVNIPIIFPLQNSHPIFPSQIFPLKNSPSFCLLCMVCRVNPILQKTLHTGSPFRGCDCLFMNKSGGY